MDEVSSKRSISMKKSLADVDHLSQRDIQWHFNPSASSHLGVSSDSGLEAISPNHFLISCACPVLPLQETLETNTNCC